MTYSFLVIIFLLYSKIEYRKDAIYLPVCMATLDNQLLNNLIVSTKHYIGRIENG
jgi:hypothetical protein